MSTTEKDVGNAPAEGKITPEAIKAAENMIGMQLRPEGPYLQDATEDTIRNFCNGIGDLNPLYRDLEVGRLTRHGSMLAHPKVLAVRVSTEKPDVYPDCEGVGVEVFHVKEA